MGGEIVLYDGQVQSSSVGGGERVITEFFFSWSDSHRLAARRLRLR